MRIFISYRRAEDNKSNIVWTIHEKLSQAFGSDHVFRDTKGIHAGDKWRSVLDREARSCKVMVVVIGPDWVNLRNDDGQKRLFDEEDITRWEVETGLKRSREEGITLIPVRVLGAQIPQKEELPQSLWQLFDFQWRELQNSHFDVDMEQLISDIRHSQGFAEDDISFDYFEPQTIFIAEGTFRMGSPAEIGIPAHETPQHEVRLPGYRIGKYPVKNSQYEEFVRQTDRTVAPGMGWDGLKVPRGLQDHPVTGVTWFDALAYCHWLIEKTGRKYSLPNEAQWEKACRGGNNFVYPWGNEFDAQRCNQGRPKLAPVNAYAAQNEYGCFDLVGNGLQWTCTLWGERRIAPDPEYLYPWKEDGRNNPNANAQIRRVVRGSPFNAEPASMRCSARSGQSPTDGGLPGARHGFRVAMNVE
jgi:formylglycine-generating enzyme required for sulfatase activity